MGLLQALEEFPPSLLSGAMRVLSEAPAERLCALPNPVGCSSQCNWHLCVTLLMQSHASVYAR